MVRAHYARPDRWTPEKEERSAPRAERGEFARVLERFAHVKRIINPTLVHLVGQLWSEAQSR